jgi:hypothetical protein
MHNNRLAFGGCQKETEFHSAHATNLKTKARFRF